MCNVILRPFYSPIKNILPKTIKSHQKVRIGGKKALNQHEFQKNIEVKKFNHYKSDQNKQISRHM